MTGQNAVSQLFANCLLHVVCSVIMLLLVLRHQFGHISRKLAAALHGMCAFHNVYAMIPTTRRSTAHITT